MGDWHCFVHIEWATTYDNAMLVFIGHRHWMAGYDDVTTIRNLTVPMRIFSMILDKEETYQSPGCCSCSIGSENRCRKVVSKVEWGPDETFMSCNTVVFSCTMGISEQNSERMTVIRSRAVWILEPWRLVIKDLIKHDIIAQCCDGHVNSECW